MRLTHLRTPGIEPVERQRLAWGRAATGALFAVLVVRLGQLQLVEGADWAERGFDNFIQTRHLFAPRGHILDRNGVSLAEDRPTFGLSILPAAVRGSIDDLLTKLDAFVGLPPGEARRVAEAVRTARGAARFREIPLRSTLTLERMTQVETRRRSLPGVIVREVRRRHYPLGPVTAHLVGYVGPVTDRDRARDGRLHAEAVVGRSGIEQSLDAELRGTDGEMHTVVDALGRPRADAPQGALPPDRRAAHPVRGRDVVLTIDARLQQRAEAVFDHPAGAAVMLDVRTGDVLLYYSKPGFDPDAFTHGVSADAWASLTADALHPLEDKVGRVTYFPGSVFKPVVEIAARMERVTHPGETVICRGGRAVGNHFFRCWDHDGHGEVDAYEAMIGSCDVYFYMIGERLGIDRLQPWGRAFGFGEPTGAFTGEAAGVMPGPAEHQRLHNRRWYKGDTVVTAIGQGDTRATALQLVTMYAALATRGTLRQPRLVDRIGTGTDETRLPAVVRRHIDVPDAVWRDVHKGLVGVVHDRRGTARGAATAGVKTAGKTGTAQVKAIDRRARTEHEISFQEQHHGLFAAYAPAENPEIAIAVVLEHGGAGAKAAVPATALIQSYFDLKARDLSAAKR